MPLIRRRPLLRAGMVGGAGYEAGKRRRQSHEAQAVSAAAATGPPAPDGAEAKRVDALTKLEGLRDSGVLTQEQYESERRRLTAGM
jgi:hypothetical protein